MSVKKIGIEVQFIAISSDKKKYSFYLILI
jgi:hypothetical protein